MSTKIYKGFLYNGDIYEAMKAIDSFRPRARELAQKLLNDFVKQVKKADETTNAWDLWCKIRRDTVSLGARMPLVDTQFELTLFPIERKTTMGMAWCEHQEWFNEFLKSDQFLSDFSYWNNSDMPEGVNAEDWEWREKMWSKALPDAGIPAECGLNISLAPVNGPFPESKTLVG